MSKFKSLKERYNEVANKIKEKSGDGQSFDDSWKFKPSLPSNKPKVNYVVRVLPNIHVDDGLGEPWFEAFAHIYTKSDGKRVYTICPTTNGKDQKCPICEKARTYWTKVNGGSASKSEEDLARAYNRKPRYFVNVLVIDDPRKGTEEDQTGKVLVWELGPQIFEKFKDAFNDQKLIFWDALEGYNFNLIIKKKGEYVNYESSHFSAAATPISQDEDEMNKAHDQIFNLPEKVVGRLRTYQELQKLLEAPTANESEDQTEGGESDTGEVSTPTPKASETTSKPSNRSSAAKADVVDEPAKEEDEEEGKDGEIDLAGLTDDELFK
jgi:hypothetical protein